MHILLIYLFAATHKLGRRIAPYTSAHKVTHMRQQEKPILESTGLLQRDPRVTINLKQPNTVEFPLPRCALVHKVS